MNEQTPRPVAPIPFDDLVEVFRAGNLLCDLIAEPLATEAEKDEAVQRWERAMAVVAKEA
jgi:hypothetical protein